MNQQIDLSKLPSKAPEYDLRDLLEAGCHFGHQKSKWNPDMEEYIYTEKNGVHIFDLAITAKQLTAAYNYMYKLGKDNKSVIFVGTKRQARKVIQETAKECGVHYITSRWLGGLFTNWPQISKSLRKMLSMESKMESGAYDNYTKFEQAQMSKQITRLRRFFDGLRELKELPDAIFVVDSEREDIAVTEANKMDIPVIALMDSDGHPDDAAIPIPANDDAVKSIELVVKQMGEAYLAGQQGK